ncbi:MAG: hypothetical protein R3B90_16450 [Planctomycetaceae bacterium]
MDLLTSVTNRQLVTIEGGLIHHDAWLTYDVLRGKLDSVEIAVPLGQRILDITADARVKGWQAREEANRQVVTVQLISAVEKQVTLEVHTEATDAAASTDVAGVSADGQVWGIHAVGAVRESGQVAVRVGDDLELTIVNQQGLTRIAADTVDARLQPGAANAFRFYTPEFQLGVAARPIEPRIIATQHTNLVFDETELRLHAIIGYSVERAGIFDVRLRVPEGIVIDDVQSPQMREESFDEASRTLTVRLTQKTQGDVNIEVRGHRELAAGDKSALDLPLLEPVEVDRETGTVQMFAPPGLEVVTDEANLLAVQPATISRQQFQGEAVLNAAWSYTRRPVRIPVTTSRKPTRLSASVASIIDVQPETTEITTQIDYFVEFAGVDTFRILVPEAVSPAVQIEAESTGSNSAAIKQKTAGDAVDGWVPWTIVMQRKVTGQQRLRVTYRLTRDGGIAADAAAAAAPPAATGTPAATANEPAESSLQLPLIRVQGKPAGAADEPEVPLSRILGEVRVSKERSLSVTAAASGGDVEPIDIRELTLVPQEGAIAYRYYRQPDDAGVSVELTRERHEIQEVAATVVEAGLIEIAIGRDAVASYRAQYRVRTALRQRLRIDLPKDLELLGVFVDGVEEDLSPVTGETGGADPTVVPYEINVSRRGRSDEAFVLTLQFNWVVNPPPFESMFGRGRSCSRCQ